MYPIHSKGILMCTSHPFIVFWSTENSLELLGCRSQFCTMYLFNVQKGTKRFCKEIIYFTPIAKLSLFSLPEVFFYGLVLRSKGLACLKFSASHNKIMSPYHIFEAFFFCIFLLSRNSRLNVSPREKIWNGTCKWLIKAIHYRYM